MRAFATLMAFTTLASSATAPLIAQENFPSKICLQVERLDDYEGLGNFKFSGRVTGNETQPHYGYWVVAFDASDYAWAQNGGGVEQDGGEVKFGVSNISTYPLKFVVMRVASAEDYKELKNRARFKRALTPQELQKLVATSPRNDCPFELDIPSKKPGTPISPKGRCNCP